MELLIDRGEFIALQPPVAQAVGINGAILLAGIHRWMATAEENAEQYRASHFHDGKWWVSDTYHGWRVTWMPWMSVATIRRTFEELEQRGVIECRLHEDLHKGIWTTINYDRVNALVAEVKRVKEGL